MALFAMIAILTSTEALMRSTSAQTRYVVRGSSVKAIPSRPLPREHLLWSPRMLRRTTMHAAWMAAVGAALGSNSIIEAVKFDRLPLWTLSLLSSSCCAIQLVLNVASVGCAGFNSILGPLRPVFLAALLHTLYYAHAAGVASFGVTALAALVTVTPELVAIFGSNGLAWRRWRRRPAPGGEVVTLLLPTMGCVACVDAVSRGLLAVPGVVDVDVGLEAKGGRATVVVQTPDESLSARLRAACKAAGFPPATDS